MEKPKSKQYYDCWQVIRYLRDKHNLPKDIDHDIFKWITDGGCYQNTIMTLYIDEHLPQHEEYGCDDYCPCKSVPEHVQKFLLLMKEFGEEITLKIWW
jgi:hypothetical protein